MAWRRSKTGQIIWYINRTYRVLPTHIYSIDDTPRFPAYYNHLKQEYVSARYRLFKSLDGLDGHFVDRDVLLFDNADAAEFGHLIDELKIAYRSAYALFDKIGLFLNDYFSVGLKVRDVYFRRIWEETVKGSPCVREVVRCSTFLYFSGGRDRTLTWDTHRNADLRC